MTISFNGIILIWCSVMSFICFMAMGIDKMGGALGGMLGMLAFRHKTKHKSFVIGMPLLLLLNISCIAGIICLARYS